jgi:hypothetical protein
VSPWADAALTCRRLAGDLEHARRRLIPAHDEKLPDRIVDALQVAHDAASGLAGTAQRLANLADRRERAEEQPARSAHFAPSAQEVPR